MAGSSEESSVEDDASSPKIKNDNKRSQGSHSGESDENEDEEYVVEKILQHQYDSDEGVFKYEVKWDGWADTTWEPLENLKDTEELKRYHNTIGGPPSIVKGARGSKNAYKQPPAKRRKLINEAIPAVPDTSTSKNTGRGQTRLPNLASTMSDRDWEADIIQVETLEQDFKEGVIVGYVRWANGEKSKHRLATLNNKCPQQMLRFYEAHLQFNQNASADNVISAGLDRTYPSDSQLQGIRGEEVSASKEQMVARSNPS